MEVQLYKIDVETSLTTKLTDAKTTNALCRPWHTRDSGAIECVTVICRAHQIS